MTPDAATLDAAQTIDAFLGGLVTLVQPLKGHRAGLDAALLQALVPADAAGHAVDLGAGVGTVAFAAAARARNLNVTAVEREPMLVAMGERALGLPANAGFAARAAMLQADAASPGNIAPADWVLMNPPFDEPRRMRPSPNAARRSAHAATEGLLESWTDSAARLLKPGGMLGLIHRAEGLPQVLASLAVPFGDLRSLPVHASNERAAIRILVRARLESRGSLKIMPGLVLHRPDGGWTPEADAILRGRAELPL